MERTAARLRHAPAAPRHRSSIWGITFASDIDLPGARQAGDSADVTVDYGGVPDALSDARSEGVAYQAAPGRFLLRVPGLASFLVEGGTTITVQPHPDAHPDAVRLLLLGTPMGALLHQRERIPLHAAAVEIDGRAVVLAGNSANGKSAVAAALHEAGYRIVADDVCAVHARDDGTAIAEVGLTELLLWRDTVERLGLDAAALPRARPELEKYRYPVATADTALPVGQIVVLDHHNEDGFEVEPIEGLGRIRVLLHQTRGSGYLEGLGAKPFHFRTTTAIAGRVPMWRLGCPRGEARPRRVRDRLLELIDASVGAAT